MYLEPSKVHNDCGDEITKSGTVPQGSQSRGASGMIWGRFAREGAMRKAIILAALVGVLASGTAYAEGWLCIADQSAGFSYDETRKKWEATIFKTDNKYLVRRPDPKQGIKTFKRKLAWEVYKFGNNVPFFGCSKEIGGLGWLACSGIGKFSFHEKALRFMRIYHFGYTHRGTLENPDNNSDTPFIEIGTCTPL